MGDAAGLAARRPRGRGVARAVGGTAGGGGRPAVAHARESGGEQRHRGRVPGAGQSAQGNRSRSGRRAHRSQRTRFLETSCNACEGTDGKKRKKNKRKENTREERQKPEGKPTKVKSG